MHFIDARNDPWKTVTGEDGPLPHPDPAAQRLLTLEQWHAVRQTWPAHLPTGVLLPNAFHRYSAIRDIREAARRIRKPLLGHDMVAGLEAYSTRGEHYIKELRHIISYNRLE